MYTFYLESVSNWSQKTQPDEKQNKSITYEN